jgi:Glycosyl hydrolase family 10
LRSTFWRSNIGDDYADSALTISRRVIGQNGYLYYNDYGGDGVNTKSTSMYNLAKKWQTNKVPIDGIGLQCHLSSGLRKQDISDNIKRFGELGLRISLTEIDIKNASTNDWKNLMDACLENFNCVSFVTWGLSDARSWIGSNCGCLLYSGTATPKTQMLEVLLTSLKNADPAVAAKRKEFITRPPGATTTPVLSYKIQKKNARNVQVGSLNLWVPNRTTEGSRFQAPVDIRGRRILDNALPVLP